MIIAESKDKNCLALGENFPMTKKAQKNLDVGDFINLKKKNDEFIASLLHDIKGPMMSINIALSNSLKNELLRDIYKLNLLNLDFIENLLHSYSFENGKQSIKLKEVNVKILLEEQLGIYKHLLNERKLTVNVTGFKTLTPVNTCALGLGRVFSNLISNAQKYALAGSKINIRAKMSKQHVLFEFTNTLQTCDTNFCEEIFDKFYSQNAHYSQGLGLYICRKITEDLNGKIWMRVSGGEITFYIGLRL